MPRARGRSASWLLLLGSVLAAAWLARPGTAGATTPRTVRHVAAEDGAGTGRAAAPPATATLWTSGAGFPCYRQPVIAGAGGGTSHGRQSH
jgi:hypothetical protein